KNSRNASELARIGKREQVAQPPYRLDHVDTQLLADAADEDLDRVGIAVEVLIVKVLDELRARHHAAGVMHEISQQPILMRRELDGIAIDGAPSVALVEPHRPAIELALGMAGRAPQQRPDPCQHLFEMKGLGDVVIGPGVEALDLVAPTV